MIRSTTSFLSAASTFPPSTTEPHGPGLSSFGPRSRVPRLPRRAGSIPPFAIFGRQVDGAPVRHGSADFANGIQVFAVTTLVGSSAKAGDRKPEVAVTRAVFDAVLQRVGCLRGRPVVV